MTTQKFGMIRHFLNDGRAVPVQTKPFTRQLTFATSHHTQKVTIGNDTGYKNVKVFPVTAKAAVYRVAIELVKGMKQPLVKRRKYRRQRRNRLI